MGQLKLLYPKVIPVAEEEDVLMAIHPDDPWNIFGLPRIITNKENLERFINLYDSKYNGLTMCSGSLGADRRNDFVDMLRYFGEKGRVNFVHARNVKLIGDKSFQNLHIYLKKVQSTCMKSLKLCIVLTIMAL